MQNSLPLSSPTHSIHLPYFSSLMLPILVTSSSLSSPDPTYPVSCKPSFLLFSLSYLSLLFSLPSLPYFLLYFILFPYPAYPVIRANFFLLSFLAYPCLSLPHLPILLTYRESFDKIRPIVKYPCSNRERAKCSFGAWIQSSSSP